jgi:hypothetical protein
MISSILPSASSQTLYGLVNLRDAHILQDIQVIGKANVEDSTLSKNLDVWGTLVANETTFDQGVHVRGNTVELRNSTINGDLQVSNYLKKPRVNLDHTQVSGRIIFNSLTKGSVEKDEKSQIKKGVKNGVVNE